MGYAASDVSDLQVAFYEAAANPDMWSDTLGKFAATFGSRGCLLTTPNFIPGGIPHSSGMHDVLDQFFSENWHTRDLRTNLARSKRCTTGFFSDHDLLSEDEMDRSDYYRGFARDAGVPWFSAALLTQEIDDDFIAISLQRSAADGEFTKAELSKLNVVLPQLRNAAELARKIATMRGKSIIDGLELAAEPAILLDRHGKVLFLNSNARDLVGSILNVVGGRVAVPGSPDGAAITTLIDKACTALSAGPATAMPDLTPVVLRSMAGSFQAIARAAPIRRSGGDVLGFEGIILIVKTLRPLERRNVSIAKDAFGLTNREAEVLGFLGEQPTLEAVGRRLDISREAVRFHLKAIFLKTNTHRQSELVAILGRLGSVEKGKL